MKKSILSLILVIVLTATVIFPANAATSQQPDTDESWSIPEEYLSNVPVEAILPANPVGIKVNDSPEDPLVVESNTRSTNVYTYGPYNTLQLDDSKMQVILSHLKKVGATYAVTYNDIVCFEFKSATAEIYIACSTFLSEQTSTTGTISNELTSALNARNSAPVYVTAYGSYPCSFPNGMSGYAWNFARLESTVYFHSDHDIYFTTEVIDSFSINIYGAMYEGYFDSTLGITPTLGVMITDTGSENLCFGGYETQGRGDAIASITDIAPLISLGYKAVSALGPVTSLTASTALELFGSIYLQGSSAGNKKKEYHMTTPKSLSGNGTQYVYRCISECAYEIRDPGDSYVLKIGLLGNRTSSTEFYVIYNRSLNVHVR